MKITIPKAAQGQNSAESRRLASKFAEAKKKTEATRKQAHLAKLAVEADTKTVKIRIDWLSRFMLISS